MCVLGANVLLAYFHYCNKGVFPFSEACRDQDVRGLAELDERKFKFVQRTKQWAIRKSRFLLTFRTILAPRCRRTWKHGLF